MSREHRHHFGTMGKENQSLHLNKTESSRVEFFTVEYNVFDFWFGLVVNNCLNVWSFMTNTVNVIVFIKQGVKKRINFTLFCLSGSDLMGAMFTTLATVGLAGDVYIMSSRIDGNSFFTFFAWLQSLFVDLSTALTVFIAIERCTCVARPLHFKSSFIALHTRGIILIIFLFILTNYIPLLATFEFYEFLNSETNVTIFKINFPTINIQLQQCNNFLLCTFLAGICLICVFVCAIIMYRGLQKSSEVRSSTHANKKKDNSQLAVLSNKERRVVKMIFFLACLYMVSSLPRISFCWTFAMNEVGPLYLALSNIFNCVTVTYGAFSIFIYFAFSSSYRVIVLRLFLPTSQTKT
ncbi:P2Y purinoceptor 2 [Biomphalaria glabrata]|nr:P2Y purinoceptor 2 [Biomphalaria glabrata]